MKKCCPIIVANLYSLSTETKIAMGQISENKHRKTFIIILINQTSKCNPLHESRSLNISLSQMVKAVNLTNHCFLINQARN